jgi:hypothetical protein
VTTRAAVRAAIAATSGSSAFSTATPPDVAVGSASTSSALAAAVASLLPNSLACAAPTLSSTPIRGGAVRHRSAMWPGPRAPISRTRCRVVGSASSTVRGSPISLLRLPRVATVGPAAASSWASRSLVDVLPDDPVTPTTSMPSGVSSSTSQRASRDRATTTSGTSTCGTSTGRVTRAAAAPWSAAAGA